MTLWTERDFPILQAVAALEASGEYEVTVGSIASTVGRDDQDTWIGLQSLQEEGYLNWTQDMRMADGTRHLAEPRLGERGRQRLGQWPEDEYSTLVTMVEARIEATADPEERKLRRGFLDRLVGIGVGSDRRSCGCASRQLIQN